MLKKSILENEKLKKRIKILKKRILAKNKTKK